MITNDTPCNVCSGVTCCTCCRYHCNVCSIATLHLQRLLQHLSTYLLHYVKYPLRILLNALILRLHSGVHQMNRTTVDYACACYQRYLRHCDIYKVSPLAFPAWLVTA